jgi:hypothetical protein
MPVTVHKYLKGNDNRATNKNANDEFRRKSSLHC